METSGMIHRSASAFSIAAPAADLAGWGKFLVGKSRISWQGNFGGFVAAKQDSSDRRPDWGFWGAGRRSRINACLRSIHLDELFVGSSLSSRRAGDFSRKLVRARLLMRCVGFLRSRKRRKRDARKQIYVALVSLGFRLFLLSQADRISMLRSLWNEHKELIHSDQSYGDGGDGRNGNGGGFGAPDDGNLSGKRSGSGLLLAFFVLCSTLLAVALTSVLVLSPVSTVTLAWLIDCTTSLAFVLSAVLVNFWLIRAAAQAGLAILRSSRALFVELRDCVASQRHWLRENSTAATTLLLLSFSTIYACLPGNRAALHSALIRARTFVLGVLHKLKSYRHRSGGMTAVSGAYNRVYNAFSRKYG